MATATPTADCNVVYSLLTRAAGRQAPPHGRGPSASGKSRRDLSGTFSLLPAHGAVAGGFVRFTYTKRGFPRPAYHPIASREPDGWLVTCDCLGFGGTGSCKHSRYLRHALAAWPCEGAELVALAPEDGDGWAGPCSRCDDPECYRVTFHLPHGGYQHYFSCAGCGRRPRL